MIGLFIKEHFYKKNTKRWGDSSAKNDHDRHSLIVKHGVCMTVV